MCWSKIANYFRRRKVRREIYKRLAREAQEREIKALSTSRGGLNMPKHQPCPDCHGAAKRYSKTESGAFYQCNKCHLTFFVKRSRRRPNIPSFQHSK